MSTRQAYGKPIQRQGHRVLLAGGVFSGITGGGGSGATSITGVNLPPDQVYQTTDLGGTNVLIAVSANYTGPAGTMQATIVNFGTSTIPSGASWQSVSVSAGLATGQITVPRGGPYAVTFRDATNGASWTSSQRIYVGDNGIFYGQSNMRYWLTAADAAYNGGFLPAPGKARRQAGAGWNVISNAVGETFSTTPPTVFGGVVNPGSQNKVGPEILGTQGSAVAQFVNQLMAYMNGAAGVYPYAVASTAASYWNPTSGTGWGVMLGNGASVSSAGFNIAPYTFGASYAIRLQGEQDSSISGLAGFPAALTAERNGLWAKTGRDANSFRFGLVTLGPTDPVTPYGTPQYFGKIRAAMLTFIADPSNGAYYAGNPIDVSLQDGVHYATSSCARLSWRFALTTARALGKLVSGSAGSFTTGAGPKPNTAGITRASNVITIPMADMDGSTSLVTGAGSTTTVAANGGFRVFDSSGNPVTINSVAISTGNKVVLTLPASGVSYPVTVDNQMDDAPFGLPPVAGQVIYGNNIIPGDTIGAPLWPFAAVSVA